MLKEITKMRGKAMFNNMGNANHTASLPKLK